MYIANLSLCQGYAVATKMYTLTFKSSSLLHLVEKGRPNQCTGVEDFRAAHKHDYTKCTISLKGNTIKYQYQSRRSKDQHNKSEVIQSCSKFLCAASLWFPDKSWGKNTLTNIPSSIGLGSTIYPLTCDLAYLDVTVRTRSVLSCILRSHQHTTDSSSTLFREDTIELLREPRGAHTANKPGKNIYDWKS